MKKHLPFILSLFLLIGGVSLAINAADNTRKTPVMEGKIGKYPVHMQLTFNCGTHKVTGWYYYNSKGAKNKIQLSGTFSGDCYDCSLNMTESHNGKVTGSFVGDYSDAIIESAYGTWRSPSGKSLQWEVTYYHPERDDD